jgi:hypothetical protein
MKIARTMVVAREVRSRRVASERVARDEEEVRGRSPKRDSSALLALVAALALAWCPPASADLADETAVAEVCAPVVRLVEQPEQCGHGEPYLPINVGILFDEPTVALRGPWGDDLIEVGPSVRDLAGGLYEYHVDFPGMRLAALAVLVALVLFGVSRATWRPSAPLRLAPRRAWGRILAAAGRIYVSRLGLFAGIGILFLPISIVVTTLRATLLQASRVVGIETEGESRGILVLLVVALGTTLFGLALVKAATACALVRIDRR